MFKEYYKLTRLDMESVDKENSLVVVPLGSVEQHGNQAPLGTDTMIADETSARTMHKLEALAESDSSCQTGDILFFPTIPVGYSVEHQSFCGSITFRAETYYNVLYDICAGLGEHGFKNIILLICHGGNRATAEIVSRQIRRDKGINVFLVATGAFGSPRVKATITPGNEKDFHGGEMETAMVMAIDESLVNLETAEAGHHAYSRPGGRLSFGGSVALPWMGEDFITDGGKPIGIGGDPSGATAEKGEIILDESAKEAAEAIIEIKRLIAENDKAFR